MEDHLREARKPPWSYLGGNIHQHLDDLAKGARPDDDVLGRIHDGLTIAEIPVAEYVELLELTDKNGCWTAKGTEAGHVSASGPLKQHRNLGAPAVKARSNVIQMRPLVNADKAKAKLMRLQAQSERLARSNPECFGGRQLYLRELNEKSDEFKADGREVDPAISQKIFNKHGSAWSSMSGDRQANFERRAEGERPQLWADLGEKRQTLRHQMQELRDEIEASREGPLCMSSCKLPREAVEKLDHAYLGKKFTEQQVQESIASRSEPIGPIAGPIADAMSGFPIPKTTTLPRPAWTRMIAYHRDFFYTCVFRLYDGFDWCYFKLCRASQSPLRCVFAILVLMDANRDDLPFADTGNSQDWPHSFRACHHSWLFTDDWPFDGDNEIEVLQGALWIGYGRVVSASDWTHLTHLEQFLVPVQELVEAGEEDDAEEIAPVIDLRYVECPWLLDDWVKDKDSAGTDKLHKTKPILFEVDAKMVFDALYEARFTWAERSDQDTPQFYWTVLGGKWTFAHTGVCYDAFAARAHSFDAKLFCESHGLPARASFAVARYTEESAFQLVLAWCHRLQWLYDRYAIDEPMPTIEEMQEVYPEPADVEAIFSHTTCKNIKARIAKLRSIVPKTKNIPASTPNSIPTGSHGKQRDARGGKGGGVG